MNSQFVSQGRVGFGFSEVEIPLPSGIRSGKERNLVVLLSGPLIPTVPGESSVVGSRNRKGPPSP